MDLILWCYIRSHSIKLGMGPKLDSAPPNAREGCTFASLGSRWEAWTTCSTVKETVSHTHTAVYGVVMKSVRFLLLIRLHKPALMPTVPLVQKLGSAGICWQPIWETCNFSFFRKLIWWHFYPVWPHGSLLVVSVFRGIQWGSPGLSKENFTYTNSMPDSLKCFGVSDFIFLIRK